MDARLLAWRARFSRLVNFLGHLSHWKSLVLGSFSVISPNAGGFDCAGLVISAEDIEVLALDRVAARTGFDCCFGSLLCRGIPISRRV